MQNNTSTSTPGQSWDVQQPSVPGMYNHQRTNSNPRSYAAPETTPVRRDDAVYPDETVNYPNYVPQYNYPVYTTPGPSRRTSGPKASTPPTAPAQPSPSRFYPETTSSPYQTSSAPPQVLTHHHVSQPQTAHPYSAGGNYYNYYDQHQFTQYPQGFQARPVPSPTVPDHQYSYDANRTQTWQRTPTTQWPGYNQQFQPPVVASQPGQYGWNPAWGQSYYPPATAPAPVVTPPVVKKGKKDKKEKPPTPEPVLGKRPAEDSTEEEGDPKKKGRKSKKEKVESPPAPKPPAKSHLHPPRQANSAWQLFFTDELNKAKAAAAQGNSPGGTPHHAKLNVAQIAKDAGAAYANLNAEQRAYYAEKVQESKEQYARDLAIWQSTLTPDDIRAENAFRAQQRKEGKSRKGNLKDPNAPKKPLSAYFLFLKGIREDDELRSKVWGDETETTRQSVLAAERWRSLSDDEKKPYLQQADKDKQDYEALRKIYEDEAAARARGEDLPPRPIIIPEVPRVSADPPKPRKKKEKKDGKPAIPELTPDVALPELTVDLDQSFDEFTHDDDEPAPEAPFHSIGVDEFNGFEDTLGDMDLSGLGGMAAESHAEGWDELQVLMDGVPEVPLPQVQEPTMETEPQPPAIETVEPVEPERPVESAMSTEIVDPDVSIAPTLSEAVEENPIETTIPVEEVTKVAEEAEGELVVPHIPETTVEEVGVEKIPENDVPEVPVNIIEEGTLPDNV